MRSLLFLAAIALLPAQAPYTLLIKGGHVIDPKNGRSAKLDVAIDGRRIAKVAADIPASKAARVVRSSPTTKMTSAGSPIGQPLNLQSPFFITVTPRSAMTHSNETSLPSRQSFAVIASPG